MDEYKIDYKTLFEESVKRFRTRIDTENRFFKVLSEIQELNHVSEVVSHNMMTFEMVDQLLLLEQILIMSKISKYLFEKYKLDVELEEGEGGVDNA